MKNKTDDTGFKVLHEYPQGKRSSCFAHPSHNLSYKPNIPTTRIVGAGPLLFFDTLDNAKQFLSSFSNPYLVVYPCSHVLSKDNEFWYNKGVYLWYERKERENGWHMFDMERKASPIFEHYPAKAAGTLFADRVTLTSDTPVWINCP
jgi:hypothetical protein